MITVSQLVAFVTIVSFLSFPKTIPSASFFETMTNVVATNVSRRVLARFPRFFLVLFILPSLAAGNPSSDKFTSNDDRYDASSYQERGYSTIRDYDRSSEWSNRSFADDPRTLDYWSGEDNEPFDRQEEPSWLSSWSPNDREFSFGGLMESMLGAVTGGLTSIVNNVFGGDSKSNKPRPTRVSYKGHQLIRTNPTSRSQIEDLLDLRESEGDDVKFWTQPMSNRSIDILISPDVTPDVKDFLRERKINFTVLIPDLQKTIAYQNPKMSKEQREDLVSSQGHSMTWKRYHRFGEVLKFLEYLAFRYPDLVELVTIGHSYEGQPLKVVKVSSGPAKDGSTKPTVWIDAGMHAREWIGTAVATYILSQLVENNTTYSKLLDTTDWMILPIANPDGYEFSHIGDRLWRKTRSRPTDNDDHARYTPTGLFYLVSHYTKWLWARCDGVDPNRNFGYHWGENKDGGASADPCHETYAGPHAFSEPETKAMSDYILENRESIRLYLTLHSYSQLWLVPWGYTHTRADDYADLASVARKGAKAIAKVHGTSYKVGPSADLLYPTSGASDDWAKGVAGIKYSYTLELRDRGTYGFLLPATQILPTARETWVGIRTIARLVAAAGT